MRRFNAAFRAHQGRSPSDLRAANARRASDRRLRLILDYRAPYDLDALLGFLKPRAVRGVEKVEGRIYTRTAEVEGRRGWIRG